MPEGIHSGYEIEFEDIKEVTWVYNDDDCTRIKEEGELALKIQEMFGDRCNLGVELDMRCKHHILNRPE